MPMTQRKMDIAILEAKEFVDNIMADWAHDYLALRAERQSSGMHQMPDGSMMPNDQMQATNGY